MITLSILYIVFVFILLVCMVVFSIPVLVGLGILVLSGILMLIKGLITLPFRLLNLFPAILVLGLVLLLL